MEAFILEVGKTYEKRDPEYVKSIGEPIEVTIIAYNNLGLAIGDDDEWYYLNGFCIDDGEPASDLVREVTFQSSPPK